MRTLPKRLAAFALAWLIAWAVAASLSHAQEALEKEAEATRAEVTRLTEQERSLHEDLAAVEDEIAALEQRIAEQEARLETLETREAGLAEKRASLEAQRDETADELAALLRELWPVHVLNTTQRGRSMETWDQADREFTWLAALYERAGATMREIREQTAALDATREEQREAAEQARAELAAINEDKDRLLQRKLEFRRRLAEVREEKLSAEEELEEVLAAIQEMEYELQREAERQAEEARRQAEAERKAEKERRQAEAERQAEEARRQAEAERQAEEARRQAEAQRQAEEARQQQAAVEAARAEFEPKPMPSLAGKQPIGGLKGRLPWPVERGTLRLGFKAEASPPHRGMGLSVHEGEPVHAVAWGKVVHNDTLRGYGKVVVLVHGEEYYSLYAYLAETSVDVGEEVESGQVLGRAGFFPELKGPGLYFELRFHQKAINPKAWLASLN